VVTRVMGLILSVIAVQMLIIGIEGTIHLFK
jgi:small neutral amino acid transporter SnatA (MarC family)